MLRFALLVAAMIATIGVAWPLGTAVFTDGGDNEATRLVEAADRTQSKAETLSDSYSQVIPPPVSLFSALAGGGSGQPASDAQAEDAQAEGDEDQPTPTPAATLTPAEHAVQDALELLNRAQQELEPGSTAYIEAVNQLKSVWDPRYARAAEEFKRFKYRVEYAEEMGADYLETQATLTRNISNAEVRARMEQVDALEREQLVRWMGQARAVLAQAQAIMTNLDDMNIRITKLELSATFASVYEGFHRMPVALTALHDELAVFEQETDRIYEVFGPKADQ